MPIGKLQNTPTPNANELTDVRRKLRQVPDAEKQYSPEATGKLSGLTVNNFFLVGFGGQKAVLPTVPERTSSLPPSALSPELVSQVCQAVSKASEVVYTTAINPQRVREENYAPPLPPRPENLPPLLPPRPVSWNPQTPSPTSPTAPAESFKLRRISPDVLATFINQSSTYTDSRRSALIKTIEVITEEELASAVPLFSAKVKADLGTDNPQKMHLLHYLAPQGYIAPPADYLEFRRSK